jgi:hypothetical protein
MRIAFAFLIGVHALIHLLGTANGFGWADVHQLRTPISPIAGSLWLAAAVFLVGAAAGFAIGAHWWWWLALPGAVISQIVIAQAWNDAKYGTIPNVLLAIPLLLAIVDARPSSFRSRFENDLRCIAVSPDARRAAGDGGRSFWPAVLMQVYLRRTGAVGHPRRAEHAYALYGPHAQQRDVAVDEGQCGAI